MNRTIAQAAPASTVSLPVRLAREAVVRRLRLITSGQLNFIEDGQRLTVGEAEADPALTATIRVLDPTLWSHVVWGGTIGAADAYVAGYWTCDNLTAVIRIFTRNRQAMSEMEGGVNAILRPLRSVAHWLKRNSKLGSRRNISAHYDLGNELFALFLDSSMMYSSAWYPHPAATLDEAATAKNERICAALGLTASDHLLEIGTGWGGFAIHAAASRGCRVTTTTISAEQHRLASERIRAAGLSERITVLLADYRDLTGTYDKLVSIEMIEAVGHRFYGRYFETCARLLKPAGAMLLQSITIADQIYHEALGAVDFIQARIFPGSCIPSVTALTQAMTAASDLRVTSLDDITPHYAKTLAAWRGRFLEQVEQVRRLGYPEEFIRLWEFYLCYCEGGFRERAIGTVQMLLAKPGWQQPGFA